MNSVVVMFVHKARPEKMMVQLEKLGFCWKCAQFIAKVWVSRVLVWGKWRVLWVSHADL